MHRMKIGKPVVLEVKIVATRCLLLGRKVMTNLDSILKSRDITSPTKANMLINTVKASVFLVVIHRYESWTIEEAEH